MSILEKKELAVKGVLSDLSLSDAIRIIERIGKHMRRKNSAQISKEVDQWANQKGLRKQIEFP